MSAKALVEIRDVIRVWIDLRAPKKGELTWAVPASASPEEALEQVLAGRDVWSSGECGFGYRAWRDHTPEFEDDDIDGEVPTRNIVIHVEWIRTEPNFNNVIPHIKQL